MSNQLTAADCDYIHNILQQRLSARDRAGLPWLTASEEDYINTLFLRLRNLENDLNWADSPEGQVIRN